MRTFAPPTRLASLLICVLGISFSVSAQDDLSLKTPDQFPRFPPVEPDRVSATFRVQAGFEMQLLVAEPLVTDPVAMVIDEQGRALVVEMNDYPYTDRTTHQAWQENVTDAPIGRVRLLEDTDGDGQYDSSTIFADKLSWPSGIACYQGGVIVTATPDIWYLKDTDGDGRADLREKIFTGFRKYNVQAVMNNPIWGLDNHLYIAGSSNGGSVLAAGQTQTKPIIARGDFRMNPANQSFELQAGGARFGNAFDDWGNRFLCNIRNPAIHVVIDSRYVARNPYYAAPSLIYNVAPAGDQMPVYRISPIEPWRDLRGRQWSADPTVKVPRSELTGGGVFTSTSGINVYRGSVYPEQYHGQLFVAEVANNVIYRQTVEPQGNTFLAQRADTDVEFVASSDTWFRPVNLYNAPDGTFYVLDMYREVIEHPWSIPDDIHARLDLTSGRDRGRIYRLAPPDFKPTSPPNLSNHSPEQLVELLTHPQSWYRETAQRLLVERQPKSVTHWLRGLLSRGSAVGVAHALWTLHGLGQLSISDIAGALQNSSPRVREQALRLAESRIAYDPELLKLVQHLASDVDARVRLQVALSLGGFPPEQAVPALIQIAHLDADDPWMHVALCSALPETTTQLLSELVIDKDHPVATSLIQSLMQVTANRQQPELTARILKQARNANDPSATSDEDSSVHRSVEDALWNGLFQVAMKRGVNLRDYFGSSNPLSGFSAEEASSWLDAQLATTSDSQHALDRRTAALARITLADERAAISVLTQLTGTAADQLIAARAIAAIGTYRSPLVSEHLLKELRRLTPSVREEALAVLTSRPERAQLLLDAIADGRLTASLLGLTRKNQLLNSPNLQIQQRAQEILGKSDAARGAVVARYIQQTPETGNWQLGERLFAQHCAACHRAAGLGVEIGPHMETVKAWDREKLILNILDPNRELAPQAMAYSIALASGAIISGMITEESSSSLTIKRPNAPDQSILREDIEQMTNTGLSLMPIGLEEVLSPIQMADLIAFLKR